MAELDSLLRARRQLWTPYYNALQQEFGVTASILDIFGVGNLPDATTWTGWGVSATGISPTWTPNEALSAFDTPFVPDQESSYLGLAPIITLNGTDEEADTPDAAYWTVTAGNAFIVWAWIKPSSVAAAARIFAKLDLTAASEDREWYFGWDSNGYPEFYIYDETNDAAVGREDQTALLTTTWSFLVGRYDGGTDAANIDILLNGTEVDDADIVDDAGFASMVNGATVVSLGYDEGTGGAKQNFLPAQILGGPWSPGMALVDATDKQIQNIYKYFRAGLGI